MTTYALTQHAEPFDWNKFLDQALTDDLTIGQVNEARSLAASWVTCAVGNLCDVLPRDEDGVPDDSKLRNLGSDFSHEISSEDWDEARTTLKKIERRSAKLINRINLVVLDSDGEPIDQNSPGLKKVRKLIKSSSFIDVMLDLESYCRIQAAEDIDPEQAAGWLKSAEAIRIDLNTNP